MIAENNVNRLLQASFFVCYGQAFQLTACFSSMFFNAAMELVWHRSIDMPSFLLPLSTDLSILWDMVLVKRTSRSGLPMSFIPAFILVYTLALQE